MVPSGEYSFWKTLNSYNSFYMCCHENRSILLKCLADGAREGIDPPYPLVTPKKVEKNDRQSVVSGKFSTKLKSKHMDNVQLTVSSWFGICK